MCKQLKTPCNQCPWRKKAAPGWLGASTPVEFLQQSEAEIHMPCHLHVDYEQDNWREQADSAPPCAGRAIHFANRCKQSKTVEKVERSEEVFTNPQEFIDHHSFGKGPKIMLVGARVVELE